MKRSQTLKSTFNKQDKIYIKMAKNKYKHQRGSWGGGGEKQVIWLNTCR